LLMYSPYLVAPVLLQLNAGVRLESVVPGALVPPGEYIAGAAITALGVLKYSGEDALPTSPLFLGQCGLVFNEG